MSVTWHPSRWWDCCVPEVKKKKEILKFGQKEVTTRDFYGQRQIIDIFTININKVVVSDKVPCNNGKYCRYIVGYQFDGGLVPLLIKTLGTYLVMACHNTIKTLPI